MTTESTVQAVGLKQDRICPYCNHQMHAEPSDGALTLIQENSVRALPTLNTYRAFREFRRERQGLFMLRGGISWEAPIPRVMHSYVSALKNLFYLGRDKLRGDDEAVSIAYQMPAVGVAFPAIFANTDTR